MGLQLSQNDWREAESPTYLHSLGNLKGKKSVEVHLQKGSGNEGSSPEKCLREPQDAQRGRRKE